VEQLDPDQGEGWVMTSDQVGRFYDDVLSNRGMLDELPVSPESFADFDEGQLPEVFRELTDGFYLEMVRLLGQRTAEMHRVLSSDASRAEFVPEDVSLLYQRSVYQSMSTLTRKVWGVFEKQMTKVPKRYGTDAKVVFDLKRKILARLNKITSKKYATAKIRTHGDYHLGQVLFTGKDFKIIDFEGEPARPLSERRLKRLPLRDVAGMIRSFHYAAYGTLYFHPALREHDIQQLQPWAELWYNCISCVFVRSYIEHLNMPQLLPSQPDDLETLINVFLLEKAVYELGYELNNRLDWLIVPLKGIQNILDVSGTGDEAVNTK
jgi:maltose alpha-D-glucosyltransferase/alpha-amylase